MRDLTKVEIHHRADGTTCPLTCSKCGAVIERGVGMSWTRETPRTFWHTACEAKRPRRKRQTAARRLEGALRRIAEAQ